MAMALQTFDRQKRKGHSDQGSKQPSASVPSKKPGPRLQARSAFQKAEASDEDEEDDDDDEDFLMPGQKRKPKPKKESLKDFFASDPPWAEPAPQSENTFGSGTAMPSNGSSSKLARMTGGAAPAVEPKPPLSTSTSSSKTPRRKMVAKDERRPPAGSKDLM